MKKNILIIILSACLSIPCSSCNFNIFSHDYSSGTYDVVNIESAHDPAGIGDEDDVDYDCDDDSNSFWTLNLTGFSWSDMFGSIFDSENQPK